MYVYIDIYVNFSVSLTPASLLVRGVPTLSAKYATLSVEKYILIMMILSRMGRKNRKIA